MPILQIEVVTADEGALDASLGPKIADTTGEVFASVAGKTWVRVRELPVGRYAENGGGPLEGVLPIFVDVLLADPPQGEALRMQIHRLTLAIAKVCERAPENVHLFYQASARGRVAFGGKLVAE